LNGHLLLPQAEEDKIPAHVDPHRPLLLAAAHPNIKKAFKHMDIGYEQ
jgi:hypothetical protein